MARAHLTKVPCARYNNSYQHSSIAVSFIVPNERVAGLAYFSWLVPMSTKELCVSKCCKTDVCLPVMQGVRLLHAQKQQGNIQARAQNSFMALYKPAYLSVFYGFTSHSTCPRHNSFNPAVGSILCKALPDLDW